MIRPLHDYVAIRPHADPLLTNAGLHIPDNYRQRAPAIGTVVAVGPDASVEVGAVVMYERSAVVVAVDGEDVALMRENGPGPCVFGCVEVLRSLYFEGEDLEHAKRCTVLRKSICGAP